MLPLMTAEQFVDQRFDLPESGQWSELERGILKNFQPPDADHGNVIRNLSRMLAIYVQNGGPGYACFDLGIALARHPDTVRFPAACHFLDGPRFAEADQPFTRNPPALVMELASTNDRRRAMTERVLGYHEFGTGVVWVIDPKEKAVHVCPKGRQPDLLSASMTLLGEPVLPGFRMAVKELFDEPDWWKA
jgi:Uma2 family endonuclease